MMDVQNRETLVNLPTLHCQVTAFVVFFFVVFSFFVVIVVILFQRLPLLLVLFRLIVLALLAVVLFPFVALVNFSWPQRELPQNIHTGDVSSFGFHSMQRRLIRDRPRTETKNYHLHPIIHIIF